MADFPNTIKTWSDLVDYPDPAASPANSSDINSVYAEVTAIESAFLTDSTGMNASTDIHGFMPKLDGYATDYLSGAGTYRSFTLAANSVLGVITLAPTSDVIAGTTDTLAIPKAISPEGLSGLLLSPTTDFDVNTTNHGFMPKLDGSSDHFLNGKGEWVTMSIP